MQQLKQNLLDHHVGSHQKRFWDHQPDSFCSPEIDNQLEFGGLHHRQLCGFFTFKDTAAVYTKQTVHFWRARSVAHQAAAVRRSALSLLNGISIGFRSGEYWGR